MEPNAHESHWGSAPTTPASAPAPPSLPTARNALRLLQYLSERERRPELELPVISEVIGLTHHETGDQIGILDDAATAIKDMQVRGAPLIRDYRIS